ncbi:MAG: DNA translocase FtsK 4TM domain-containing protein, partial [Melioribacteraceae bacterium]|nr:DNA translocase FtsK 4TM domain-containing protein [Melioribacteraceae bacterium]
TGNPLPISNERKKKLLGVSLIIVALLALLSILSHSKLDTASLFGFTDLFKIFSSDPEFVNRASSVHNWLGIFGAYLSDFFINSTIGYFSIAFPVVLFIWGLTILKSDNYKLSLHLSNFLLAFAIILATFFGMLRVELNLLNDYREISGNVGDFFGGGIGILLGGLGSIIVLISILIVSTIVAFDIKVEKIFNFIKGNIQGALESGEGETKITVKNNIEENNLEKLLTLTKKEKKSKSSLLKRKKSTLDELDTIDSQAIAEPEETKITIVHKMKNEEPEKIDPSLEPLEPQISKDTLARKNEAVISNVSEEDENLPEPWEEKIKFKPPSITLLDVPQEEELR